MPKTLRSFYASDIQWHILTILGKGNASQKIQNVADRYAKKIGAVTSERNGNTITLYGKDGEPVAVVEVPSSRRSKVAPSNS